MSLSRDEIREVVTEVLDIVRPVVMTHDQLCDVLHITRPTLRKLIVKGLPVHSLGAKLDRFVWSEVESWIKAQKGAA
jgi:predicted DNA-binding transcriptional regulator AlpA